MLSGGHPNSLGNTVEVVEQVLADVSLFDALYQCYFSADETVRLRTSNAMKRICKEQPGWLVPYIDKFLSEISKIDQASAQWTLASLFLALQDEMSDAQKLKATKVMQHNLDHSSDWIVQNTTIETLGAWAKQNNGLKSWLLPRLKAFATSTRKSVAAKAAKVLAALN